MATWLRFHCPATGEGIFPAAYDLLERDDIEKRDRVRLERQRDWFRENLRAPRRFQRASKGESALCWFRDDAKRCLRRAWIMAALLERYGVVLEFLRTKQPGYVTYEDRHQIAAIPFADRGVRVLRRSARR